LLLATPPEEVRELVEDAFGGCLSGSKAKHRNVTKSLPVFTQKLAELAERDLACAFADGARVWKGPLFGGVEPAAALAKVTVEAGHGLSASAKASM
jgi:hypothetical protein